MDSSSTTRVLKWKRRDLYGGLVSGSVWPIMFRLGVLGSNLLKSHRKREICTRHHASKNIVTLYASTYLIWRWAKTDDTHQVPCQQKHCSRFCQQVSDLEVGLGRCYFSKVWYSRIIETDSHVLFMPFGFLMFGLVTVREKFTDNENMQQGSKNKCDGNSFAERDKGLDEQIANLLAWTW